MTRRFAISGCVFSLLVVALTVVLSTSVAQAQTPSTTALSPAPVSPSVLGQSVAFTATVTGGPPTPTGQVTFLDGGVAIGSAILNGTGQATFSTAKLVTGSHSIVASYGGDGTFSPSVSAALPYTVGQRATTLNLGAPSPNPVGVGAVSTVAATVIDAATTGPAGTPGAFAALLATSDLNTGRSGQTATLMLDGTVLVTGGTDSTGTILDSAELFDPTAGTFTTLVSHLNTPRTGHTATLLPDGTVLFIGGTTTGPAEVATAELYDPLAGTFTTLTAPGSSLSTARANHTATLIGGKVLVAGGTAAGISLNTVEVYDPVAQTFSTATGNLAVTRSGHAATLLSDGTTILITGGDAAGTVEAITYSGTTVSTSGTATWAIARSRHTSTLLPDGNVLITGGLVSGIAVSTVELYQVPASLSPFPTSFATVAPTSGLNTARAGHTAVLLNSALVLIAGGLDATTPTPATLNTAESYTPAFDPLGQITLSGGPTDIPTNCNLILSGTGATTCNATDKPTAVGTPSSRTLTLTYSGDANHTAPTAQTTTLQVVPGDVTIAVTSSANPSVFGQSVTFTATITVGGGTPSGTVTFLDGGTTLGTVSLSGNVATFTTSSLATASHTITVSYSGDLNFNPIPSTPLATNPQVVSAASTSTAASNQTITYSNNPPPVTLSATVTNTATGSTAVVNEGTVSFTVWQGPVGTGTVIGTATTSPTVSNGNASVSYTLPNKTASNVYTIQAVYNPAATGANFTTSTDTSHTLTVGAAGTTTNVTSTPNPSVFGQLVTFTATVSPTPDGGTVTFTSGTPPTTMCNAVAVNTTTGQATCTDATLPVGTDAVTAAYSGDTNFDPSTGTLSPPQTVNQAATTTAVNSSVNPSVHGQAVTFSATVSAVAPGAGTPTGQAQLVIDGANVGSPVSLVGGVATFPAIATLVTSPPAHTVAVNYLGDTNFLTSTGTLSPPQTVNQAATATAVNSSVNPSVHGQAVTFSATVSAVAPGAGTPTGLVQLVIDGANVGSPVSLVGGAATFPAIATLATSPPAHTVAVNYLGDANFLTSTGTLSPPQTVNQAATTTAVNSSVNPSVHGQAVTFSATVSAVAPGVGTPAGTAQLVIDGANVGSPVSLVGGVATFPAIATLVTSPPAHTVAVNYLADTNFLTSTGNLPTQTVNKADTATALASSANPQVVAQLVTLTATVTSAGGTPTGNVTFFDGGATLGTTNLNGSGVATLTTAALAGGVHPITATYNGDSNFNVSTTPAPLSQAILDFQLPATLPPISIIQGFSDSTTMLQLQSLGHFASAQITGTCAPLPPAFTDATCTVNSGNPITLTADGTATPSVPITLGPATNHLASTLTPPGTYTLTLTLTDQNTSITHTVPLSVTVVQNIPPTCATMSSTTPFLSVGSDNQTVKATVVCADPENDISTITVDWGDGTAKQAITSGVALSHTYAQPGAYKVFAGATDVANLVSNVVSESVTLTAQTPVIPGNSVTVTAPLASSATFSGTVTFACVSVSTTNGTSTALSDYGLGCTFNPTSADLATTTQVQVTVSTKATSAASQRALPNRRFAPLYALWLGIPGIVFLGLGISVKTQGRRLELRSLRFLGLWVALSLSLLIVACGGGFTRPGPLPGPGGTPAGTYFLTINGVDANNTVQTTIVLEILVGA